MVNTRGKKRQSEIVEPPLNSPVKEQTPREESSLSPIKSPIKISPEASHVPTPVSSSANVSQEAVALDEPHSSVSHKVENSSHEPHYEFGGTFGVIGIIFGLPLVIYSLFFLCHKEFCDYNVLPFDSWVDRFKQTLPDVNDLVSMEAVYMVGGWMLFHVGLERLLPGEVALGQTLPNGKRLQYTISGHLQFWVTLAVMFHGAILLGPSKETEGDVVSHGAGHVLGFHALPLDLIYDHYVQLATVSIIGSTLLSIYL
jgi:hypothetical protein